MKLRNRYIATCTCIALRGVLISQESQGLTIYVSNDTSTDADFEVDGYHGWLLIFDH